MLHTPRPIARRLRPGFTLLEMMLVVVIMGILMTVAIVSFRGRVESAKVSTTAARLMQIKTALDEYYGFHSTYPPMLNILTVGATAPLQPNALNDAWNRPFQYFFPGTSGDPAKPFDLYSFGPDGLPTPADNVDVWNLQQR
jgi:general secretion pathway protein G